MATTRWIRRGTTPTSRAVLAIRTRRLVRRPAGIAPCRLRHSRAPAKSRMSSELGEVARGEHRPRSGIAGGRNQLIGIGALPRGIEEGPTRGADPQTVPKGPVRPPPRWRDRWSVTPGRGRNQGRLRNGEVDGRRDDVRQAEQGQRRVVAEGRERRDRLQGVELVVWPNRPMREAIEAVGCALCRPLLGAPSQRTSANSVLSGLRGREEAVLRSGGGEKIFP